MLSRGVSSPILTTFFVSCHLCRLSETASLPDDEAQFMHDSFNLFLAVSPIFLFVKPSKLLRRNNATHLLQVCHPPQQHRLH